MKIFWGVLHVKQASQADSPQEDKDSQTKTFGDYSESPNIVLLGDPGVGKNHLFKQFSAFHRANYLTVRHFLSGVPIDNQKALFIDALDEKRSSHNSSDVIDVIVRRLFSQTPQKVRISCRSQDIYESYQRIEDVLFIKESDFIRHFEHLLQITRSAIFSFTFMVRHEGMKEKKEDIHYLTRELHAKKYPEDWE